MGEYESITAKSYKAQSLYAVHHAIEYFIKRELRYSRIREYVRVDTNSLERDVSVEWRPRLPSELMHSATQMDEMVEGPGLWVYPLWPMRRGQLLSSLELEVLGGTARIVSRRRSSELTTMILITLWRTARRDLRRLRLVHPAHEQEAHVEALIEQVLEGNDEDSRSAVQALKSLREEVPADTQAGQSLGNLVDAAAFLRQRYFLWFETDRRPGEVAQLRYTYRTRFAPEYGAVGIAPRQSELGARMRSIVGYAYGAVKRFVGQPPSLVLIPVSRYGLANSYHLQSDAPQNHFFKTFQFLETKKPPEERRASRSATRHVAPGRKARKAGASAFSSRVSEIPGASMQGEDDAGGGLGHLYLRNVPSRIGLRTFLLEVTQEIPPGATAPVSILALAMALFVSATYGNWETITALELATPLAAFALAAAFATMWFDHTFTAEGRLLRPMAARLGLWVAAWSAIATFFALVIVWLNHSQELSAHLDIAGVQWPADSARVHVRLVSLYAVLVVVPQALVTVLVWQQRLRFYWTYRRGQRRVAERYGA